MEVKGTVTQILENVTGTSAKGEWCKQTFILTESNDQYPKQIAIDVFNEKVTIPAVGTMVNASINVDSREYNGKWYTNVGAWKMEVLSASNAPNSNTQIPPAPTDEPTDDLPF